MSEANGQAPRLYTLARASTRKQEASPATQQEMMEAARQTMNLPERIPVEEPLGTSGKTKFALRPIGSFLMRTLRKGDFLMVTKLDRLGRNLRDVYDTVDALFRRGVNIIILHGWGNQIVDMRNATHRIMLLLLAWFAEYEREQIAERTKEGLHHRRINGLSDGHHAFTYIQCYRSDGTAIPKGEFDRKRGDFKRNEPDREWLDQLLQLLTLQKTLRWNGQLLYDYCRERDFTNHAGKRWWDGKLHVRERNDRPMRVKTYRNEISKALKQVRRMAVLGQLPEDYSERVLAITGDTPVDILPKWQYKVPRPKVGQPAPATEDRSTWTLEDWQNDWKNQQDQSLPL